MLQVVHLRPVRGGLLQPLRCRSCRLRLLTALLGHRPPSSPGRRLTAQGPVLENRRGRCVASLQKEADLDSSAHVPSNKGDPFGFTNALAPPVIALMYLGDVQKMTCPPLRASELCRKRTLKAENGQLLDGKSSSRHGSAASTLSNIPFTSSQVNQRTLVVGLLGQDQPSISQEVHVGTAPYRH